MSVLQPAATPRTCYRLYPLGFSTDRTGILYSLGRFNFSRTTCSGLFAPYLQIEYNQPCAPWKDQAVICPGFRTAVQALCQSNGSHKGRRLRFRNFLT